MSDTPMTREPDSNGNPKVRLLHAACGRPWAQHQVVSGGVAICPKPTPMTREPSPHMHDCEHGFDRTLCYCDTPEACLCVTEDDNVEAAPAPTVEPSHLQEAGAASTPMTREPSDSCPTCGADDPDAAMLWIATSPEGWPLLCRDVWHNRRLILPDTEGEQDG